VIGPSQAVPIGVPSLVLDDAAIDWSTAKTYPAGTLPSGGVGPAGGYVPKPVNYDAVVDAAADEAGGRGLVTELAGPASQFRDRMWSPLDQQNVAMLRSQRADGVDAVVSASRLFGGWDGFRDAVREATTLSAGITIDDFCSDPVRYRRRAQVDAAKFSRLLKELVTDPVAEAGALFYRAPYLTRFDGRMKRGAATIDPAFDYNFDLAQVSNVHVARRLSLCARPLAPDDAPWRMKLPQGGVIAGHGGRWPVDMHSMPANLTVVRLSPSGAGAVVEDNRVAIGTALLRAAGTMSDLTIFRLPQIGLPIGGTQSLPLGPAAKVAEPEPPTRSGCSVSRPSFREVPSPACLPIVGAVLTLRRWRSRRLRSGA
jgi:hypothetical protein